MAVSPPSLGGFALGGKQLEHPVGIAHSPAATVASMHEAMRCTLRVSESAQTSGETQLCSASGVLVNASLTPEGSGQPGLRQWTISALWIPSLPVSSYQVEVIQLQTFPRSSQELFEPVQVSSRCHCRKTSVCGEKPTQKGSKNVRGKGELGDEVMKAI